MPRQIRGSSPHTRGTVFLVLVLVVPERFIPAHAGNGLVARSGEKKYPVHPRTRGERIGRGKRATASRGSSPHTRGTGGGYAARGAGYRFIPAHAGNGRPRSYARWWTAVHPRTRGERPFSLTIETVDNGSSPHTRGTVPCLSLLFGQRRFIPAHAGNGPNITFGFWPVAVHPRTRGERPSSPPPRALSIGSSPHTRGTVSPRSASVVPGRFIPAHAGNGSHPGPASKPYTVHPRTRGERAIDLCRSQTCFGSSPHTRGTDSSS